jgi:hypothetical protein
MNSKSVGAWIQYERRQLYYLYQVLYIVPGSTTVVQYEIAARATIVLSTIVRLAIVDCTPVSGNGVENIYKCLRYISLYVSCRVCIYDALLCKTFKQKQYAEM